MNQNLSKKQVWFAIAGIVFVLILIGKATGGDSNSSAQATDTPATAATPVAATGSAHITMLHGRKSDNSCVEAPGEARIYIVITLRNTGDADGTVNPWATFDYSDGGNSTESYSTNYGHDLTVPAHSDVDATFYHTYNPQQHYMLRCAGYADLYSSDTGGYYLPMR